MDPVSAILGVGSKLIDRLWPNPEQRDAAKLKLFELQQTGELAVLAAETDLAKAQIATNQEEARSSKLFVSGWRPFIGWVCGTAFAYAYVIQPLLVFALAVRGHKLDLPQIEFGEMSAVLFGMLGLGTMRTVEKVKKAA